MISRHEANRIAQKWAHESVPPGATPTLRIDEFDLGYVVSVQTSGESARFGLGIIDRTTGELSVWPALPLKTAMEQYRERKATRPQTLWTWDPAEQARWDLRHIATPSNVSHLHLTGRKVTARSVKGDREPLLHRLVVDFFASALPRDHRERGYDRCSEAAALSDALHAEDARRVSAGDPPITLEQARDELFAGAEMVTYRVREFGDPVAGTTTPPCVSCARLLRHFGFQLRPLARAGGSATSDGAGDDA